MDDALVLGDFNGHDPMWYSNIADSRGEDFAEIISQSHYGVLNQDNPTRLPIDNQPTSPDVSLASNSILLTTSWETRTTLRSDHIPIIIRIQLEQPIVYGSVRRTFINLAKTNWVKWTEETEKGFEKCETPTDALAGEKMFRKVTNIANKHNTPSGRIPIVRPSMPTATAKLADERDEIRKTDASSPRIEELNVQIEEETNEYRRTKWRNHLDTFSGRTNVSKLWKTVKTLINGNQQQDPNRPVCFKGKMITSNYNIAQAFNKQYTTVCEKKPNRCARKINRKIRRRSLNDALSFTADEISKAIATARPSPAVGPDKLTVIHLKHLGRKGIEYLTAVFNLSLKSSKIPDIWKQSVIVPLLKPTKEASEAKSYRPVSLLCPSIKILEKLLLPTVLEHLKPADGQHGFRPRHSTVTALHQLNNQITTGFNLTKPPGRTVVVAVDLSKAFDTVCHTTLLEDLNKSTLPGSLVRWFAGYLHGRQSRVLFRNKLSKARLVLCGVPQGAVTSPAFFNYYIASAPKPPENVSLISYADDTTIASTGRGRDISPLCDAINGFMPKLMAFYKKRNLMVSPEKSSVTLFSDGFV